MVLDGALGLIHVLALLDMRCGVTLDAVGVEVAGVAEGCQRPPQAVAVIR